MSSILSTILLLLLAWSPLATSQRFDLGQLSLRAAAEAQAGSSGYFNCPEQVQRMNIFHFNPLKLLLWGSVMMNLSMQSVSKLQVSKYELKHGW